MKTKKFSTSLMLLLLLLTLISLFPNEKSHYLLAETDSDCSPKIEKREITIPVQSIS